MKFNILLMTAVMALAVVTLTGCIGNFDFGAGTSPGQKACTEEAKVCPDGSSVGRDPENNCEFPPCPAGNGGKLIGGDKDEHGCLIAAGYSWNETAGVCMRPWSGEIQCGECPQFAPPRPGWCDGGTIVPGVVDDCGCRMPPMCVNKLTVQEALQIASGSNCTQEGRLNGSSSFYNPNSMTWWIDMTLNTPKPGCNPACVVSEESRTAEINWRCTGLIVPT